MPERSIKSKKLFYPEPLNKYNFIAGKLITKNKIKSAVKKLNKVAKKYSDIKNTLGRKALDKAAKSETLQNIIEAVPMGDTLNSVIKLGDKAIKKADEIADKIKSKQYNKQEFKKDLKEMKEDKDFIKLKDKITNWYKDKVEPNKQLTEPEKKEIKDNLESLNLEEASKLKAPELAGLLTNRNSNTIKAKYRKALGISQKTLSNKGGRLFLASGKSCKGFEISQGGKIEPKKPKSEIYKTLFE